MKKRFTRILAALALLVFMTPSLAGWGQTRDEVVDVLVASSFAATNTTYTDFSNVIFTSDAVYAGNSAKTSNGGIQLRSKNSNSGIVSTASGGTIHSVAITVESGSNTLDIYGKNTAYTSASDLYNSQTQGTKIGSISATGPVDLGTNVDKFAYIGIRSNNGAIYLTDITVTWTTSGGGPTVAAPTFSLASGETGTTLIDEDIVMLDCETEGATIYYTMGDNPADPDDQSTEYDPDNGIEISATTTIKAIAYVGEDHSSVASKTYTILTMKTITEARAQETGAVYTQGTVTSITGSSAFIQDATAAINVYGDNSLVVGKKYNVVGTLTTYSGLLEITNPTCTEVVGGTVIEPEVMTIANILTSTNQGWFIKIEGATVGSTSNNNTTLTQNGSSIVARYLSGAEEGDVINLTGNISCYGETKQIANPLVVVGPTITVDETALSFTYIVGGSAEAQTLAITGTNTTEAIVAAVAEGDSYFSISNDEVNWSSTLQLPAAGDAIVVRLNPGLTNGTYNGTITLTSTNAETVTVTLTGEVTNQTYAINLNQPTTGGTIAANKEVAEAGETVTLTATPATGYAFGEWTVLKDDLETEVEVNNNQFVMPNCEVLVSGTFSQIDYTITVAETTNGTVECEDQTAHYGDEILVTITPSEGYRVASFTVAENGGEGSVTDIEIADDIYSFSMPAYNVTITVVFEVIPDVYGGEGTFNKVTALSELEDGGYYVLVYNDYAMTNEVNSDNYMVGSNDFVLANNAIINPSKSIVWKLEADEENWKLYNEEEEEYCYISGTNTKSFHMASSTEYSFIVTVNANSEFLFKTTHSSARCIANYQGTTFRAYAANNNPTPAVYLYKLGEASQDPYITVSPDAVTVPGAGGQGTLTITYDNLSSPTFTIQYYEENQGEYQPVQQTPAWMNNVAVVATTDGYVVNYTIAQNNDADREARFKLLVGDVSSNLVTFTQSKYVAPVTYSLATNIVSGKHYIITNGTDKAMGAQGYNNRPAVDVTIENNVATVNSADVYEFVINGPDANGYYTIYDASVPGYLFAAGTGKNNYLRTQTFNDGNGQWTINIDQDGAATIIAQGTNTNNRMRFNNTLFSCYGEGSSVTALPYLYKKDGETNYTFYKDIAAYQGEGGYVLVASPVSISPAEAGMITDGLGATATPDNSTYDLYKFDQAQELEWINYRRGEFGIEPGKGYLYANKNNVTLTFAGVPSTTSTATLSLSGNGDFPGWNLVGNPFGVNAYIGNRSFYVMNETGTDLIEGSGAIAPMNGIFVIAANDGEELQFTTTPTGGKSSRLGFNLSNGRNVIDRATVRFDEGDELPKFQLNKNHTKVYFSMDGEDYAVVRGEEMGAMPVNFKAENNGTYSLSLSSENVELSYLHLIDNMTGADVDLLQTPSYSFEAKTTDYESRFKLVFATGDNSNDDNFAFYSNGSFVINNEGNAELQVIDIMGRIVKSESVNGCTNVNVNAAPGVYMLRLVNGDNVKTQKVVVK